MKINYVAPITELSGYGEFARNVISGLVSVGADIRIQPIQINKDGGQIGECFQALLGRHAKPDISIVNTVPTLAQQFLHPTAPNCIFTMWETDRLPDVWARACNRFGLVLTPSSHSCQVFSQACKIPVQLAMPAMDFAELDGRVRQSRGPDQPFVFYSIFQWTERKNPTGLIRAYWAAFSGRDDVVLRLKLYLRDQNPRELERINAEISALKRSVRLRHYPKIELLTAPMSRAQIIAFHLQGDCYVTASRGEGLGMGLLESMALATPCIATKTSGHLDFASDSPGSENCRVIPTYQAPCTGMGDYAPWYDGQMMWDEADLYRLAEAMRFSLEGSKARAGLDGACTNLPMASFAARDVRSLYNFTDRSKQLLETLESHLKKS